VKVVNHGVPSLSVGTDCYSREFTVVKKDHEEPAWVKSGKAVQLFGHLGQITVKRDQHWFFLGALWYKML